MRKGMVMAAMLMAGAAAPALAVPKDFKARADAILAEAYPADGPGAIVLVYEKGKPVYSAGRGLADVAAKRPLDPASAMRLGSITKQFTAAVVMQLVEEGKVRLDDPLSAYLPDFPKPGADATVRQLLNHTSGVKSYTALPEAMTAAATPRTTAEMIALFKDAKPEAPNGARWAYNNSGYVLLGAIIEKATGEPWHAEVDRRIARPLGLTSLRYGGLPDAEKGMANGYSRDEAGKPVPARPIHMSFPHAAGALVSTTEDLARFGRALSAGKVVKPASYALMAAPTRLADGKTEPYGFGLIPGKVRGRPLVGHDGGIFGFSTDGIYLPAEDIYVAVFANADRPVTDPELVTRKLAALALGDPFEPLAAQPLDLKSVEPMLGIYRDGDVERMVYVRDGKLFTKRKGGGALEVQSAGNGRYFYADSLSWFALERGADGKPAMLWHADGEAQGTRMAWAGAVPAEAPIVALPRAELDRLAGTYRGPMPVPILVAVNAEGQLTLKFGEQQVTHLMPEAPTLFRVKEVDAKISFQVEGGKVAGLTIHQGGRELPAKRAD